MEDIREKLDRLSIDNSLKENEEKEREAEGADAEIGNEASRRKLPNIVKLVQRKMDHENANNQDL